MLLVAYRQAVQGLAQVLDAVALYLAEHSRHYHADKDKDENDHEVLFFHGFRRFERFIQIYGVFF